MNLRNILIHLENKIENSKINWDKAIYRFAICFESFLIILGWLVFAQIPKQEITNSFLFEWIIVCLFGLAIIWMCYVRLKHLK